MTKLKISRVQKNVNEPKKLVKKVIPVKKTAKSGSSSFPLFHFYCVKTFICLFWENHEEKKIEKLKFK